MLFVREDIPAKILGSEKLPIERFYVELILRWQKWLINYLHNPFRVLITEYLNLISKKLYLQSSKYGCFVFAGDFNVGIKNKTMKVICKLYGLTSLNNKSTFYKKPANPTCIDLILTTCP